MSIVKKPIFIIALAILILVLIPGLADEESEILETNDHLLYRIENNTAVITGYTGDEKVLVIPTRIDDYDVVCIDKRAFISNEKIWTVILPQTVTEIREYAFHQSSLRNIVLPNSIKRIEDGVFSDSHLTSIYLPSSVTEIGDAVFDSCYSLRSVKIDGQIKKIPHLTFFECICLYDVDLPECLEAIEEEAFYFCRELRFIDIPQGVSFIDDTAFFDCKELWDHPVLKDYFGDFSDSDEEDEEYSVD